MSESIDRAPETAENEENADTPDELTPEELGDVAGGIRMDKTGLSNTIRFPTRPTLDPKKVDFGGEDPGW